MPTYVVLTNLTDYGRKTVRDNPGRIHEVNAELKAMGVTLKDQYAVFGPYDFVNIMEAEDDGVLTKALIQLASRGTATTMTLPATPTDEWVKRIGG
ncbi:MAG: GYD domain-containing protein [Actinobacteria bacterium]|nr:GYD domain-containing protein [Actinomycetota bacterium]